MRRQQALDCTLFRCGAQQKCGTELFRRVTLRCSYFLGVFCNTLDERFGGVSGKLSSTWVEQETDDCWLRLGVAHNPLYLRGNTGVQFICNAAKAC